MGTRFVEKIRPRVVTYQEFSSKNWVWLEVQQEKLDFGMKLIHALKQDNVAAHGDD